MKKFNKGFTADDSSSYEIETIGYDFTETDKERLKICTEILKNNPFISHMIIDVDGSVEFFDDADELVEWRTNIIQFIVYPNCIYFYTEHKHNSSDCFESEEIALSDVF